MSFLECKGNLLNFTGSKRYIFSYFNFFEIGMNLKINELERIRF